MWPFTIFCMDDRPCNAFSNVAIHHLAFIAMLARRLQYDVNDDFGMNPSTVHRLRRTGELWDAYSIVVRSTVIVDGLFGRRISSDEYYFCFEAPSSFSIRFLMQFYIPFVCFIDSNWNVDLDISYNSYCSCNYTSTILMTVLIFIRVFTFIYCCSKKALTLFWGKMRMKPTTQ